MGNVELRSWAIAAGMLGERKPDIAAFEPSWHHTYATTRLRSSRRRSAAIRCTIPPIHPERVRLTQVLHRLANDERRARALCPAIPRPMPRRQVWRRRRNGALAALDQTRMLALGIHPAGVLPGPHADRSRQRKARGRAKSWSCKFPSPLPAAIMTARAPSRTGACRSRAAPSPIFRWSRKKCSSAPSAIRNSTRASSRAAPICASPMRARRAISASPPSSRACSAIPASMSAPTAASARRRT